MGSHPRGFALRGARGVSVRASQTTLRTGPVRLMWVFVAIYLIGLILPEFLPVTSRPSVYGWPGVAGLAGLWTCVGVCWLTVRRAGRRQREVWLVASAVTAQVLGLSYVAIVSLVRGSSPLPSPADIGFTAFNLLMLTGLVVAVHNDPRGLASSVWLDSAVGALGAAAVLAVLLSPVLAPALGGSPTFGRVVTVTYPMSDLLLVAAVTGIATVRGRRAGLRWVLLGLGFAAFAATDVVYALQRNAGSFELGSPLDGGWAIGLALMAMSVDRAAPRSRTVLEPRTDTETRTTALAVSTVATLAALTVLVVGTRAPLSTAAVVLAAITLLAATARTQLAFGQLAQMARRRQRESVTDHLTGLPNRRALATEARVLLADRNPGRRALLLLDLDKFKEVNDSLGHHVGDLLLIDVGARLRRELDQRDLLARLGGDEFAVLLRNTDRDRAARVAVQLRDALAEPFVLAGMALHSSVSIGIAAFPDDGLDLSSLLRKADIALYKAKSSGEGHHQYGSADDTHGADRLRTMDELRTAMTTDGLVLHYQPKADLPSGDVRGVEALVRWQHPTRGLLYPDDFIGLVEEAGLMREMTRIVLAQALDQVAAWRAHGRDLTVAVNLSASSLIDAGLPDEVAGMLTSRGVPPCALRLEITEEFLMADRDRARAILTRLRDGGIQIAVDDFGTGYSSLAYLRDLPIDELKLDRSFVLPMDDDPRAAALVASTIALAHSLGLRMVAEGVENSVAYAELTRLGCDQVQGYFVSRPIPADELEVWLRDAEPGLAVDHAI